MGPAEPGVWARAGFPICSSVQTNLEVYGDHPGDQNPRFLTLTFTGKEKAHVPTMGLEKFTSSPEIEF